MGLCPEYFLDQQEELKIERNPLYKFLTLHSEYKEGNIVLLEDIRSEFSEWLGSSVKTLDNGTFGQVNKEYIIEQIKSCKSCNKPHKKDCCSSYHRLNRSNKKIVRNIKLRID
jgi:hypothetical protein